MSQNPNHIYAYVGGHVTCVDITSGQEVWRTPVPGGTSFVASLVTRDNAVILGHRGRMHGFDAATGNLLWSNDLKGLGYGTVFLANAGDGQATSVMHAAAQRTNS